MNEHIEHPVPGGEGAPDEREHVWDKPRNVKLLFNVFYACCVILVVLDFVIPRHNVHDWENLLAFYPLYGFVGIWLLVLIAKQDQPGASRYRFEQPCHHGEVDHGGLIDDDYICAEGVVLSVAEGAEAVRLIAKPAMESRPFFGDMPADFILELQF